VFGLMRFPLDRESISASSSTGDDASCVVARPLLAAAALGALESSEQAGVWFHLQRCRACAREYADYRDAIELLPYAVPQEQPPPSLRRRVLDAVRGRSDPVKIRPRWLASVAAALLLIVVLGGSNLLLWSRLDRAQSDLAAIENRRRVASTLPLVWYDLASADPAAGGARGTLCAQDGGDVAWLITESLPQAPVGQIYRAWLSDGAHLVSAGTFRVDDRGRGFLTIRLSQPIEAYRALDVTLGPADGSSDEPGPPVLIGSI
jgi:anti-sigma factor RsiW